MGWRHDTWGSSRESTVAGREVNLTCSVEDSHPEPTFRWYRGAVDFSEDAHNTTSTWGENGMW